MGLAYERMGSGPPLVLLHGVGHRRQAWGAVLDRLTPHRDVIMVDLPGHGESPPLEEGLPIVDALLGPVTALLGDLGVAHPHVAGNSLGGRLALEAAAAGRAVVYGAIINRPSRMSAEQAQGDMAAFLAAHDALEVILAELTPFTGQIPDGCPVTIAWGSNPRAPVGDLAGERGQFRQDHLERVVGGQERGHI